MSCLRRAGLAIHVFRSLLSKTNIPSKNLSTDVNYQFRQYRFSNSSLIGLRSKFLAKDSYQFKHFCSSCPSISSSAVVSKFSIFQRFGLVNQACKSAKATKKTKFWVVSGVASLSAYYERRDTVPYTNPSRFILVPEKITNLSGEVLFQIFTEKHMFAPETDPRSIRVRSILEVIIVALRKDVKQDCARTKHLDKLEWEVVIEDESENLAKTLPNRKIVVSGKFFRDFGTDTEIATVIGHEVAPVIARHTAEKLTTELWCSVILLITRALCKMYPGYAPFRLLNHKVEDLPFSCKRRNEIEADYIGMLLIASAGYDPLHCT